MAGFYNVKPDQFFAIRPALAGLYDFKDRLKSLGVLED
jgi:hypothetical protein